MGDADPRHHRPDLVLPGFRQRRSPLQELRASLLRQRSVDQGRSSPARAVGEMAKGPSHKAGWLVALGRLQATAASGRITQMASRKHLRAKLMHAGTGAARRTPAGASIYQRQGFVLCLKIRFTRWLDDRDRVSSTRRERASDTSRRITSLYDSPAFAAREKPPAKSERSNWGSRR